MKKKTALVTLLIGVMSLSGCTLIKYTHDSSSNDDQSSSGHNNSSSQSSESSSETSSSSSSSITTQDGYYKANQLSMLSKDINSSYAPAIGAQKILVIPIELNPGTETDYSTWTTTDLSNLNKYYFGAKTDTPNNWNSLKTYYETASFGKLTISGMVTAKYTGSSLTMSDINEDTTYQNLFSLISEAVSWAESTYNTTNWSDYDTNDDGYIDSVHLITNYGYGSWSEPLWPHMYNTGASKGTLSNPTANVYSMSSLGHADSSSGARTAIHEQGHIFGLEDYYDYSYSNVDYVGQADMQSNNVMDWNSYSKMTVGWSLPYVVTGEKASTEITINPASTSGDCIVVPVPGSWNGSAFDEYFLLELFTPVGNNSDDWTEWSQSLGTGGVRMYHVDSRLYSFGSSDYENESYNGENVVKITGGQFIDSIPTDTSSSQLLLACNNSYEAQAYGMYVASTSNHPLLALLQAGKTNTFGSTSSSARHGLSSADLFKTGSTFNFANYSKFLNKNGTTPTTMDDGSTFPYTITFNSVSATSATITFTK